MIKPIPKKKFLQLIKFGPLIAIDLLIVNSKKEVLLGNRTNNPAINSWFVPGGCIRKNESFKEAFGRVTFNELGMKCDFKSAKFLGVYEHFYKNNFDNKKFGTHYVVHAYKFKLKFALKKLPVEQHSKYKWFSIKSILTNKKVHTNTKNYIKLSL
tara:strand:+ start:616 stop:1080 length:465 start_codon:yes stop_codon:yes gene_type:complete